VKSIRKEGTNGGNQRGERPRSSGGLYSMGKKTKQNTEKSRKHNGGGGKVGHEKIRPEKPKL